MSTASAKLGSDKQQQKGEATAAAIPALPTAITDADSTKKIMRTLRHFHLGDPAASETLEALNKNYLPALLNPYRDASRLRYDYPLFLFPPQTSAHSPEQIAKPLVQFFQGIVAAFAPGENAARILKDNISWLERDIRERINTQDGPIKAEPLFTKSAQALEKHLTLDTENSARLNNDLQKLLAAIPKQGQLLGYGQHPAIHLLIHVIRCHVIPRHEKFKQDVKQYIRELKTLLDVDWNKSSESFKPEKVKESVGVASNLFDAGALSSIMDHSQGSVVMSAERRQRVDNALSVLEAYEHNPIHIQFIHTGNLSDACVASAPGFEAIIDPDPCAAATRVFDEEANRLATVFAAARTAKLEIDNRYDPTIHDPWLANFNWEAFSKDELLLVPAVIALEPADRVSSDGMPAFSRLLNSGRPIQILVRVRAHDNPGAPRDEDPFQTYRTELGYLGISHRQAVVAQSSAARHQHLIQRFSSALDATRTSLHLINIGLRPTGQDLGLNAWLVAGAALEGRAHPFFHINPVAGDSAAERMDFSGNPQPERDWPIHNFKYRTQNGEVVESDLAFTFADYALLIQRLHKHFVLAPETCDSDDLIPVDAYLALAEDDACQSVPFVWAINEHGVLRKLVITRTLVHACRDRLNFWHTLQELAGVRNRYVELAIKATQQTMCEEAAKERQQLEAEHNSEIERIRAETAGEVMSRLTDALLNMDFTASTPNLRPTSAPPKPLANIPAEAVAPEPESAIETSTEEEEPSFSEPWIDSPLCTSCNDCLVINPIMYVYDENNQAYITDPNTGTYAQLVEGAEICPSNCIHPGLPQNPNEPGLEDLIQRAAPYN